MITADRLRELLDYDPAAGIFRWKVRCNQHAVVGSVAGYVRKDGYRDICIGRRHYKAHRLAWLYVHGEWPDRDLDHRDTIKDHNWIGNLRPATMSQNKANSRRRPDNASGFKGVYFHKARPPRRPYGKWAASIRLNGRLLSLGYFATAGEAHAAYVRAAAELFGEFARAE